MIVSRFFLELFVCSDVASSPPLKDIESEQWQSLALNKSVDLCGDVGRSSNLPVLVLLSRCLCKTKSERIHQFQVSLFLWVLKPISLEARINREKPAAGRSRYADISYLPKSNWPDGGSLQKYGLLAHPCFLQVFGGMGERGSVRIVTLPPTNMEVRSVALRKHSSKCLTMRL